MNTSKSNKLIAEQNSPCIKGIEFIDKNTGRQMLLKALDERVIWLCYKRPDNHWISLKPATQEDCNSILSAHDKNINKGILYTHIPSDTSSEKPTVKSKAEFPYSTPYCSSDAVHRVTQASNSSLNPNLITKAYLDRLEIELNSWLLHIRTIKKEYKEENEIAVVINYFSEPK
jgi:hypothetical protein